MMKNTLAIYIILSFVALAVFGFTAMGHEGSAHAGCVAAASQSADCPGETGALEFAAFHLRAFRSFSSVDVSTNVLTVFFLAVFFELARELFGSQARKHLLRSLAPAAFSIYRDQSFAPPVELTLWRWLALHENSHSTP